MYKNNSCRFTYTNIFKYKIFKKCKTRYLYYHFCKKIIKRRQMLEKILEKNIWQNVLEPFFEKK